jgi:hypothetical protein
MELTEEQWKVVRFDPSVRHHKINAVAGSGKTRTLCALIASLVQQRGVDPERLFVVTFTRNGAEEMKERLQRVGVYLPYLNTFHALAMKTMGLEQSPLVALSEYPRRLLDRLDTLDIDYIIVDETQDVDETQYEIIKRVAELNPSCYVFGFGDVSQNIFQWRGSHIRFFGQFLPDTKEYPLSENFRSSPEIIQLANASVSSSVRMVSRQPSGRKPACRKFKHIWEERDAVCGDAVHILQNGFTVAVLCRTNLLVKRFRSELLRRGVKCASMPKHNRVGVMTMHASKGLEFDYVFVVGANDADFPMKKEDPQDVEEDRRLFHVAVTRAKRGLSISYTIPNSPSRYVYEHVPEGTYDERCGIEAMRDSFQHSTQEKSRGTFCSAWGLARGCEPETFADIRRRGLFPVAFQTSVVHEEVSPPLVMEDDECAEEIWMYVTQMLRRGLGCVSNPLVEAYLTSKWNDTRFETRIQSAYDRLKTGSATLGDLACLSAAELAFLTKDQSPLYKLMRQTPFSYHDFGYVDAALEALRGDETSRFFVEGQLDLFRESLDTVVGSVSIAVTVESVSAEAVLDHLLRVAVVAPDTVTSLCYYHPFEGTLTTVPVGGAPLELLEVMRATVQDSM